MAKHVEPLLDIILSSEFRDIINDDGKVVGPESEVYKTISNRMNGTIKYTYIYTIIKNNRYNILDTILRFFGMEVKHCATNNGFSDDSVSEDVVYDEFTIDLSYDIWTKISPEDIIYNDKKMYRSLKRKVWTDEIYQALYDKTKLPCALAFGGCQMSKTGIYVTVTGTCEECGCKFTGKIINKPETQSSVVMECFLENCDLRIQHVKKRQLRGQRRVEICKSLVERNKKPCVLRRDLADKLMEFGDAEPPHLPKINTLRKAKQLSKDQSLGVIQGIDPLTRILQMKGAMYAGSIHGVGADPFFVHYWTLEQMATYVLYPNVIYIDATGSVVTKIKKTNGQLSPHIYLYQIVCKTPSAKMPVFQMLSAVQNTNAIQYWLFEIMRIGSLKKSNFPLPQEVVSDFDKALMGAISRAFGQCKNLRDYLSKCLLAINEDSRSHLPRCYLRLDISHYVAFVARWKLFRSVNPIVKKFYIRVMCLFTKITTLKAFKKLVKSALILSYSETCGKTENGTNSLAEEARIFITECIKGVESFSDTHDEITEDSLFSEEEFNEDDDDDGQDTVDSWANLFFQECTNEAREATIGNDANAYYCPEISRKIKYMLPYFPLYTGVMISIFGYGAINASSSAVESEFHDIKRRVFGSEYTLPLRVDKFLTIHLRSFSGKAKLAVAGFSNNSTKVTEKVEYVKFKSNLEVDESVNKLADDPAEDEVLNDDIENIEEILNENSASSELVAEQNWRNKNPAKKIKRSYLDPLPDWDIIQNTKSGHKIDLLLNGNICELIVERRCQFVVTNTCGFDSVMQILAVACRHKKFENFVTSTKTPTFSFLRLFLENGSSVKVYKSRAYILKEIKYFVNTDSDVPGRISIDACSNISNLCEYVFHRDWSVMEQFTCDICKKKKTFTKVLAPINIDIINRHTFKHLEEALQNGGLSTRRCCGKSFELVITYGSHIFIECEVNRSISVEEFPQYVQLIDRRYALAGLVMYKNDSHDYHNAINSLGHYTAWVKRSNHWVEFDDLIKKSPLSIKFLNEKTPRLCVYVEI